MKIKNCAALVVELGDKVIFCLTDVTSEESVNNSIARAQEQFGAIHCCVNAVGCGWTERTVSKKGAHSFPVFEQIIRLNLLGTFNVASKAAQAMSENAPNEAGERGVIVNVASVAAFEGQIGQAAYATSKGAVVSMTLPKARDLAILGIRVMAVAPGMFHTPLLAMLPPEV
jgi:NAD(P)-dependent dehydrogenase (short-subunit alcohol dehydrogenase family)